MFEFFSTPIEDILHVTNILYPNVGCTINLLHPENMDKNFRKSNGYTLLKDSGEISIYLNYTQSYYSMLKTLAHEIAHAIVGAKEQHNEKWKNTFHEICEAYEKYCDDKYGKDCLCTHESND